MNGSKGIKAHLLLVSNVRIANQATTINIRKQSGIIMYSHGPGVKERQTTITDISHRTLMIDVDCSVSVKLMS